MPSTGGRFGYCALTFALLLMVTLSAGAQSGYAVLSSSDYKHLLQRANKGNIDAQMSLGVRYQYGFSVPRDLRQAEFWLHRAAGLGSPPAQVQLGLLYLQPEMVAEHSQDAMRWFTRASASGQPEAEFNIALMYLRGWGISKNLAEADRWLRKADRHGVKRAKALLATLLLQSTEPQRRIEGFELLRKSSKHDADSRNALGYCYEFGIGTTRNMESAVRLYRQAAEDGNVDAMYSLSLLYYSGKEVPQDSTESFRWSKRACDGGNAAACWFLGVLYLRGEGVPKDLVLAYSHLAICHANAETIAKLDSVLSDNERAIAIAQAEAWEKAHAVQLSSLPVYVSVAPDSASVETAAGN